MTEIIRQNPMLGVMAGLLLAALLVSGLFMLIMGRSSASMKPIAFFLITFMIVLLPQLIGHLAMATKPGRAKADAMMARATDAAPDLAAILGLPVFTIAVNNGLVSDPEHVFGPSMPGASFEDSRALFSSRMPGLLAANSASLPTGETITALVFGNDAQATDGLLAYLTMHEVAVELDCGGAEVKGVRGLGQDRLHLLRSGSSMIIVTAPMEEMLHARMAAIPMLQKNEVPQGEVGAHGEPLVPALQPLGRLFASTWAKVLGTVLLVLLVSIWFIKGAVWAGSVPAADGVALLGEQQLRERLLSTNRADVPMTVEELSDGRITITWRYADARWMDMMSAHRMVRTHRMVLRFDEEDRAVKVIEQWAMFDASAGANGARLQWSTGLGITLFQVDHRKVYGLQFGPDGKPTGDLNYRYSFNLQELKAPFIAAVTHAGWSWRTVLLVAPPALRWLTE